MFKGANYDYWKEIMIAFFESTHIDMLDVVEKGNRIPLNAQRNEIPRDQWTDEHKSRFLLNFHADMLCCVFYLKKSIPKFTNSKALNKCGTH